TIGKSADCQKLVKEMQKNWFFVVRIVLHRNAAVCFHGRVVAEEIKNQSCTPSCAAFCLIHEQLFVYDLLVQSNEHTCVTFATETPTCTCWCLYSCAQWLCFPLFCVKWSLPRSEGA